MKKRNQSPSSRIFNAVMTVFAKTVVGLSQAILKLIKTVTGTKDKKHFAH
ncbi:MAG: hypothetical protein LAT84_09365 [Balneolia bacterium]|nr:hypothetical protein [Balneolia bacterium]